MNHNRITIIGRIAKEPKKYQSANDQTFIPLKVVEIKYYREKDGEDLKESPRLHTVMVWSPRAISRLEMMKKGDFVLVEGELDYYIQERDVNGEKIKVTNAVISPGKVSAMSSTVTDELPELGEEDDLPF